MKTTILVMIPLLFGCGGAEMEPASAQMGGKSDGKKTLPAATETCDPYELKETNNSATTATVLSSRQAPFQYGPDKRVPAATTTAGTWPANDVDWFVFYAETAFFKGSDPYVSGGGACVGCLAPNASVTILGQPSAAMKYEVCVGVETSYEDLRGLSCKNGITVEPAAEMAEGITGCCYVTGEPKVVLTNESNQFLGVQQDVFVRVRPVGNNSACQKYQLSYQPHSEQYPGRVYPK